MRQIDHPERSTVVLIGHFVAAPNQDCTASDLRTLGDRTFAVQDGGVDGWLWLVAAGVVTCLTGRWLRDWGATPGKWWMALPGDELIRDRAEMTVVIRPVTAAMTRLRPLGIKARAERADRMAGSTVAASVPP